MGLTKASTGNNVLLEDLAYTNSDYTVAIAREP